MMILQFLLGFSFFVLLVLNANGVPVKGSKTLQQDSSGTNEGSSVASQRASAAPLSYRAPSGVFKQEPSHPQFVQTAPLYVGVSSMPGAGYSTGSIPVNLGNVPGALAGSSAIYYAPGFNSGSQQAGAASFPEAKWTMAPQAFEEASTNTQSQGSSAFLPSPPGPPTPVLQTGGTSNVVKEAELGNYQQQTEEFGYPAGHTGPGQGFPLAATPSLGVGGLWGYPCPYPLTYPFPYPYPYFDYRLLYGLDPSGTYTAFSKNHAKGTDYFQNIHHLKEHGTDRHQTSQTPENPGSGQQKVYQGTS